MTQRILTALCTAGALLLAFMPIGPANAQQSAANLVSANSEANLLSNGGFETMKPAYWASTGAGAEWSMEQTRTPGRSLKLSGGTGDWVMDEGVRAWVGGFPGDGTPEIEFGAWVYTEGVNMAPTSDDQKFQLIFEFLDVPGGTNVLGAPLVLDVPQASASSGGWVELSSLALGAVVFPSSKAATSAKVTFRQGANTTGTVYLEDLFVRGLTDGWAGDWFNANMDAGDTWYYWMDGMASGKSDWETSRTHFMYVTDAEAHSGTHSLLIESNGTNSPETVAISDRVAVTAGEPVLFSFWLKREGNSAPLEIGTGQNNLGLTIIWYDNLAGGAAGWGEIGGADVIMNQDGNENFIPHLVQEAADGWKQYAYVAYPKDGAIATEARLRYWHAFDGKTYWDDVFIAAVADMSGDLSALNLLSNGGFETMKPAYWASTGAGAEWSMEQTRTPGSSLKLSGGTGDWVMDEGVRAWVGGFPGDGTPEIEFGAWVYTEGVNMAPTSDDQKFQLIFEFLDVPGGTNVLGAPLVLDVPQASASSGGWVELSSLALGAVVFPSSKAATSAKVTFRQGANTTGTVYLEDLFVRGLTDGWAGDWFNANMDAGDTWYYWMDGMASGKADWETSRTHFMYVTDAEAHSGTHSLLIESNGTNSPETVAISDRVAVTAGEPVLFSFWLKREGNSAPLEIGTGQNNLGLTIIWYDNLAGGAAGWGEIGGADAIMNQDGNENFIPHLVQEAAEGWKQYAFVAYPKDGAIATEARLRYWHAFDGKTYWDDVSIVPLSGSALVGTGIEDDVIRGAELPTHFALFQNYPNPFNPTTSINFDLVTEAQVSLSVYNVLGQRVASLLSGNRMPAGQHGVTFDASALQSGVYMYVIEVNGAATARSMVLMK